MSVSSWRIAMVVPGSAQVKAQAEAEGLDRIFSEAGCNRTCPGASAAALGALACWAAAAVLPPQPTKAIARLAATAQAQPWRNE